MWLVTSPLPQHQFPPPSLAGKSTDPLTLSQNSHLCPEAPPILPFPLQAIQLFTKTSQKVMEKTLTEHSDR